MEEHRGAHGRAAEGAERSEAETSSGKPDIPRRSSHHGEDQRAAERSKTHAEPSFSPDGLPEYELQTWQDEGDEGISLYEDEIVLHGVRDTDDPFDDEELDVVEVEDVMVSHPASSPSDPSAQSTQNGSPSSSQGFGAIHVNRQDVPTIETVLSPNAMQGAYGGAGVQYAGAPGHAAPKARKQKRSVWSILGIVAVCLLVLVGIGFYVYKALVINVTVNGEPQRLVSDFSASTLVERSGISPDPGNLLAVDGSLLQVDGGYPYTITVNGGEPTHDDVQLSDGDTVVITDGTDKLEPVTEEVVAIPPAVVNTGTGAVHVYSAQDRQVAAQNVIRRTTGELSGKVKEEQIGEQVQVNLEHQNVDVGDDKVIALTFDDGPWKDYTAQILDVLAENDAKATFFTVGERVDKNPDLTARAFNEGHEVCTHSYDHAAGSGNGVDLGRMTVEEQIAEIQKGNEAITNATGQENIAARIIRSPGGNYGDAVASTLEPYVDAEIGWNIDTHDWQRPGTEVITERILSVEPGGIILMHDGGGDRSQTVEALRTALPELKAQGYRFVTISELLDLGDILERPQAASDEDDAAGGEDADGQDGQGA